MPRLLLRLPAKRYYGGMIAMESDRTIGLNVAANLRRILAARGMSQSALARQIDAKQSTINTICIGRSCPQVGILARIAEVLDVSIDALAATPKENLKNAS